MSYAERKALKAEQRRKANASAMNQRNNHASSWETDTRFDARCSETFYCPFSLPPQNSASGPMA